LSCNILVYLVICYVKKIVYEQQAFDYTCLSPLSHQLTQPKQVKHAS